MEDKKIIRVRLHRPYNGIQDYFFKNMRHIYDILPNNIVGISYDAITNIKLSETKFYANKCCVITLENLH